MGGAPDGSGAAGGVPPPAVPNPFGAAPGSATAGALGPPQGMPAPAAAPAQPGAVPGGFGSVIASLTPEQRVQAGLAAVGMKDVGAAIAPDFETLPSGIQINKKTGQPTGQTFPITDNQGHSIRMVPDGQRGYGISDSEGARCRRLRNSRTRPRRPKRALPSGRKPTKTATSFTQPTRTLFATYRAACPARIAPRVAYSGGQGAPGGGMGGQGGQGGAQGQGAVSRRSLARAHLVSHENRRARCDRYARALDLTPTPRQTRLPKYQQLGAVSQKRSTKAARPRRTRHYRKNKSVIPGYKGGTSLNYALGYRTTSTADVVDMRGNLGMRQRLFVTANILINSWWAKAPAPRPPKRLSTRGWRRCSEQQEIATMASKWEAWQEQLSARNPQGLCFLDKLQQWSNANPLFGQKRGNDGWPNHDRLRRDLRRRCRVQFAARRDRAPIQLGQQLCSLTRFPRKAQTENPQVIARLLASDYGRD